MPIKINPLPPLSVVLEWLVYDVVEGTITAEDAHAAYRVSEAKYYGEWARQDAAKIVAVKAILGCDESEES
jgi:hypothetical protein